MRNPRHSEDPGAGPVFLDVATAQGLLFREGATLIDARAPRDVAAGRAKDSDSWPARDVHPVVDGVRRVASADDLGRQARRRGVHATPVVVYGSKGGADAAHLWWTLTAYGHPATFLLDGGFDAWREAGAPVTNQPPEEPGGGTFAPHPDPAASATTAEIAASLERGDALLLDTRSAEEASGEIAAAARGGRIPGAHNIDWERAVTADGRLRDRHELEDLYARFLPDQDLIAYCQSGVRAAHTLAVLRHLGNSRARLYLGSWGEWGNRPDLPVARSPSEEAAT